MLGSLLRDRFREKSFSCGAYYFLLTGLTRLPIPTFDFSRFFLASWLLLISDFVLGVLDETRLVGRQYSFLPPCPQGLPDFVSCHFSDFQRFNDAPLADFFTLPFALRHLAICWDARAEGNTFTRLLTFL